MVPMCAYRLYDAAESTGSRLGRPLLGLPNAQQTNPASPLGRRGRAYPCLPFNTSIPSPFVTILSHMKLRPTHCSIDEISYASSMSLRFHVPSTSLGTPCGERPTWGSSAYPKGAVWVGVTWEAEGGLRRFQWSLRLAVSSSTPAGYHGLFHHFPLSCGA
jgi:hypothetical protein